jgi:hypothetical protein
MPSDSGAWGIGDTASAAGGILYLVVGLLRIPARRTFDGFVVLLATGVSLTPLIMILVDPIVQNFTMRLLGNQHPPHLIETVTSESRITLWWACAVAAAYLVKELFSPVRVTNVLASDVLTAEVVPADQSTALQVQQTEKARS